MEVIDKEVQTLKGSDLFLLNLRVQKAAAEGRDLLAELAKKIIKQILQASERLAAMSVSKT